MATCGYESNAISLDAYDIASLVFSNEEIDKEYQSSLISNLKSIDLRTYFEMLVIVATEGMKLHYAGPDNMVDVRNITPEHIVYINRFLEKIQVQMVIEVVSRIDWNFDESKRKISYKEKIINTRTPLEDLHFILDKDDYLVISFHRI
jgi:hypothetical protein